MRKLLLVGLINILLVVLLSGCSLFGKDTPEQAYGKANFIIADNTNDMAVWGAKATKILEKHTRGNRVIDGDSEDVHKVITVGEKLLDKINNTKAPEGLNEKQKEAFDNIIEVEGNAVQVLVDGAKLLVKYDGRSIPKAEQRRFMESLEDLSDSNLDRLNKRYKATFKGMTADYSKVDQDKLEKLRDKEAIRDFLDE